jgi:hypothetical protein
MQPLLTCVSRVGAHTYYRPALADNKLDIVTTMLTAAVQ